MCSRSADLFLMCMQKHFVWFTVCFYEDLARHALHHSSIMFNCVLYVLQLSWSTTGLHDCDPCTQLQTPIVTSVRMRLCACACGNLLLEESLEPDLRVHHAVLSTSVPCMLAGGPRRGEQSDLHASMEEGWHGRWLASQAGGLAAEVQGPHD